MGGFGGVKTARFRGVWAEIERNFRTYLAINN